jgi:hypothetical protein
MPQEKVMQRSRSSLTLIGAALLLGVAACQDAPSAPRTSPLGAGSRAAFDAGGNSAAAHQCQHGGYASVFRADGSAFANAGECTSYAAQGGVLAHRVTASFTNVWFSSCNALTWGYAIDGVSTDVASKADGCVSRVPEPDASVTYLSTQTLHVYLRDDTCGFTYRDDGLHSLVAGTNPRTIEITDSGGFCESNPGLPRPPGGAGNLNVTETASGQ